MMGDGLPANWTVCKRHFPDFEPIPDFLLLAMNSETVITIFPPRGGASHSESIRKGALAGEIERFVL